MPEVPLTRHGTRLRVLYPTKIADWERQDHTRSRKANKADYKSWFLQFRHGKRRSYNVR